MNSRAEIALDNFMQNFDEVLKMCDELERDGRWDVERDGFMSVFFESDLFSVVLEMMSADGVFENAEAEVVNRMFSTDYTPQDLRKLYADLSPVINDYCDVEAKDSIQILEEIDPYAADRYRNLILGAVDVVSMADGIAEGPEVELIEKLRSSLQA